MDEQEFRAANRKSTRKMLVGVGLALIPGIAGFVGARVYNDSHPITPAPELTPEIVIYHKAMKALPMESIAGEAGIPGEEITRVRSYVDLRERDDDVMAYDTQRKLHFEESMDEVDRTLWIVIPSFLLTAFGLYGAGIRNINRRNRIRRERFSF